MDSESYIQSLFEKKNIPSNKKKSKKKSKKKVKKIN